MTREIKFRAWDTKEKKMLFPNWLGCSFNGQIHTISTHHINSKERKDIKDIVLMQFTGLNDKNGVEIYEGDIVEAVHGTHDYHAKSRKEKSFNCEVVWSTDRWTYKWPKDYGNYRWGKNLQNTKVIGNIYQNPELLK